jgi:signal transduction histidine kinase/CheY-like chemotaxis protein
MTNDHGHILVVDDNKMNRLKLSRSLEKQGHAVTLAENGRQALEMMQAQSFDLTLLDIVMPEVDGYQVLERLKRDSTLRDIPVIVISAVDEMESIVKCVRMGAEDYLPKPFDPVLLRARIGACLEKKRLRDKLALLNQVGQELGATLDLPRVVGRLLRAGTEIVGAGGALVWLQDRAQGGLVCQTALYHDQEHLLQNLRLSPEQGIAGWVAENGKKVIVPHAPDDPRFFPGIDEQIGSRTTSLLAVPLWARDTVIGVLEVINKPDGNFDEDDCALVETLAASAASALENARLVEALRQRTVELETRNEELDAFAHTVAHDLKNPLTVINGFAAVLKRSFTRMSEAKLRGQLSLIAQHGSRMNNIIDELLLLSSVRKMEEIDLQPLDMAAIVAEAQGRLAYSIEECQAEIVLPDTWPLALGYGPWVEEVWVNYLSNALKYGGHPPHVVFGSSPPLVGSKGEQIRFWIRDNGPGLTPEEQARLFTPFTRLDQVRAKGHGLGLSIVRRIMEKLGGQVGVESVVGEGSVFSFTLPGVPG